MAFRTRYRLLDRACSRLGCVVLPHSYDTPASLFELRVGVCVSSAIRLDLLAPPLGVLLWPCAVLRTPVPEAPVDENGDPEPWERDVGTAAGARQRVVDAKAKATAVKQRPKGGFGRGVSLSLRLHPAQGVRRRSGGGAPFGHASSLRRHCLRST